MIKERIFSPMTILWLTLMWILLWGGFTWGNLVNGLLVAVLVGVVFPLPRASDLSRFRPLAVLVLVGHFIVDVTRSGFRVAWAAIRPGNSPRSAVIRVQLRSHSDFILATTAALTTLIPGSVAINSQRLRGIVYLHVFDVPKENPQRYLRDFRRTVLAQEERLLRAFASEAELADAGYRPGWRVGSGDLEVAQ